MRTVYKYVMDLSPEPKILMPVGAEILKIDVVRSEVVIYALVEEQSVMTTRVFRLFGTGSPCSSQSEKYIGSVQVDGGQFVFHVFDA